MGLKSRKEIHPPDVSVSPNRPLLSDSEHSKVTTLPATSTIEIKGLLCLGCRRIHVWTPWRVLGGNERVPHFGHTLSLHKRAVNARPCLPRHAPDVSSMFTLFFEPLYELYMLYAQGVCSRRSYARASDRTISIVDLPNPSFRLAVAYWA